MTIADVIILNLSLGIVSVVIHRKLLNRLKKRKRNEEKHKGLQKAVKMFNQNKNDNLLTLAEHVRTGLTEEKQI